jgi:pyrimidine operon attenuation protein/uracil phosphoribosyltransferase
MTLLMDEADIRRAVRRIAHEIVERNRGTEALVIVGIHTRGVPLAVRVAAALGEIAGDEVEVGELDVTRHRDDLSGVEPVSRGLTRIEGSITDKVVVLVDDVLYTGRTARAGLDALTDLGRPRRVELAVLVDRGHREIPIRADYVAKNVPSSMSQWVTVALVEVDGVDSVVLEEVAG